MRVITVNVSYILTPQTILDCVWIEYLSETGLNSVIEIPGYYIRIIIENLISIPINMVDLFYIKDLDVYITSNIQGLFDVNEPTFLCDMNNYDISFVKKLKYMSSFCDIQIRTN